MALLQRTRTAIVRPRPLHVPTAVAAVVLGLVAGVLAAPELLA
ncbi:hypothetical protein [Oerskovia flava]|nr:hypothetical protein [Oerskovia sp. JB1-3-2]